VACGLDPLPRVAPSAHMAWLVRQDGKRRLLIVNDLRVTGTDFA
jgi:hypothetical protein